MLRTCCYGPLAVKKWLGPCLARESRIVAESDVFQSNPKDNHNLLGFRATLCDKGLGTPHKSWRQGAVGFEEVRGGGLARVHRRAVIARSPTCCQISLDTLVRVRPWFRRQDPLRVVSSRFSPKNQPRSALAPWARGLSAFWEDRFRGKPRNNMDLFVLPMHSGSEGDPYF